MVERLHMGIVIQPLVHALHDPELSQPVSEHIAGMFCAAVAMKDQSAPRPATMHTSLERTWRLSPVEVAQKIS